MRERSETPAIGEPVSLAADCHSRRATRFEQCRAIDQRSAVAVMACQAVGSASGFARLFASAAERLMVVGIARWPLFGQADKANFAAVDDTSERLEREDAMKLQIVAQSMSARLRSNQDMGCAAETGVESVFETAGAEMVRRAQEGVALAPVCRHSDKPSPSPWQGR